MGIGTTARACLKNKRKFIGSELCKDHYDTSIKYIKNNLKLYENISE